jgi:hypothetical protein
MWVAETVTLEVFGAECVFVESVASLQMIWQTFVYDGRAVFTLSVRGVALVPLRPVGTVECMRGNQEVGKESHDWQS